MSDSMNVVAHNLQAMYSNRQLGIVAGKKDKSSEKLSSGYRINRAADDAAGLSMSEKMRRQIRGLTQGTKNVQDGISMCQIADGALAEVHDMLHRLTELSIKSANGTNNAEDRQAIQDEVNEILTDIDRISTTTTFNEKRIFDSDINQLRRPTYSEAKEQLLGSSYAKFPSDITLSNGQTLSQEDTNLLVSFLGNVAITSDLYNEYYNNGEDAVKAMLKDYLPELMKNCHVSYEKEIETSGGSHPIIDAEQALTSDPENPNYSIAQSKYEETMAAISGSPGDSPEKGLRYWPAQIMRNTTGILRGYPGLGTAHAIDEMSHLSMLEVRDLFNKAGINGSETFDICAAWIPSMMSVNGLKGDHLDMAIRGYISLFSDEQQDASNNIWIQSGTEANDGIMMKFGEMNTDVLGINGLNVSSQSGAQSAISKVKGGLEKLSTIRSEIGAQQNRLEHTIKHQENTIENTQRAESLIRDTDIADEMMKFSAANVLQQAGQSMLTQANQSNQGVLSLLQ